MRRCIRRGTQPAVADDIGGDALTDLEAHLGHEEDGEVIVRVRIDEAGGKGQTGGHDLGAGVLGGEVTDRFDPPARHAHIGGSGTSPVPS